MPIYFLPSAGPTLTKHPSNSRSSESLKRGSLVEFPGFSQAAPSGNQKPLHIPHGFLMILKEVVLALS